MGSKDAGHKVLRVEQGPTQGVESAQCCAIVSCKVLIVLETNYLGGKTYKVVPGQAAQGDDNRKEHNKG